MLKPAVAIALIMAGVFLVALPPLADGLWRADAVRLMEKPGISNVNLEGQMEPAYKYLCLLAGIGIVGIALRFSIPRGPAKDAGRFGAEV